MPIPQAMHVAPCSLQVALVGLVVEPLLSVLSIASLKAWTKESALLFDVHQGRQRDSSTCC